MIEITKPKITYVSYPPEEETNFSYGKFVVEPLERGYGVTLGNTLRRVLLSSLPGAGPVAVRVDGVLHEFSIIPGVMEDMTEIVLNLKGIICRLNTNEPVTIRVEINSEGVLTAGDFNTNDDIEIINQDHHIATVTKQGKLGIEIIFARGRGFVPAEKHERQDASISTIFMDSIFSPVKRVRYEVQDARIGQEIKFDRLIIEVWTDGSVKPDEAVNFAARFFNEYLQLFIQFMEADKLEQEVTMVVPEKEEEEKKLDILVKDLEFSVRARNCLKRANIKMLGELCDMTVADLLAIKNFGKKSLNEIKDKLAQYGLALKGEGDEEEAKEGSG